MSNTTIDRTGNPNDLLTTTEAAGLLGMTARSFAVARSAGSLHIAPAAKHGATNLYCRSDLWDAADARVAAREPGPCGIPGCPLTGHQGRGGQCREHAALIAAGTQREALHGRPALVCTRTPDRADRFETKTHRGTGDACDEWLRGVGRDGYGNVWDGGKTRRAHVVSFELKKKRAVRQGYELDHECENRLCVKVGPGHVVEVSHAENMRRMAARLAAHKAARAAASRRSVPVDALLTLAVERPDATLVELWELAAVLPEAA